MDNKLDQNYRDRNQVPNDFFRMWSILTKDPYKEVIQAHVKKTPEDELMYASQFESETFSKSVQKELFDKSKHMLLVESMFYKKDFQKEISITDALRWFLRIASANIAYFNKNYNKDLCVMLDLHQLTQKQKNELFSLYQLTTLFLAFAAKKDKKLRKLIGIKKGLFFT